MSPAEARVKEEPSGMTDAEWNQRINLAACYRLVAYYGWDDLVDTHISARVPGPEHHFLINPYGLMFDEITASSPLASPSTPRFTKCARMPAACFICTRPTAPQWRAAWKACCRSTRPRS